MAGDISKLIDQWQKGDRSAEQALFDAMYDSLHDIAGRIMRSERPNQTLGATGLVHEAYLRFCEAETLQISDRAHFLAFAAMVMRRIVVDRARARNAQKRSGEAVPIELNDGIVSTPNEAERILAVEEALQLLQAKAPRQAKLVELRYFAGFTLDEIAAILGMSTRTARREWQVARTRLRGVIDGSAAV
jgi:RNA polymerase sigma factor (TIGR02999 family)